MNLPKRAVDAHKTLADAYNTGDLQTVLKMYDYEGIIVPKPGEPVSGREAFEKAIKGILSIEGKMEIKTVYSWKRTEWPWVAQNGILATETK